MSDTSRRRLLAEAAVAVGINLNQLAADEHPWSSSHPMARAWQMAVKELSPSVGEELEAEHGQPLSMGLALALEGSAPLTQDQLAEWQTKRPQAFREYKEQSIAEALTRMKDEVAARQAANTPEAIAARDSKLREALLLSRQQAALHQQRQHQSR